MDPRPFCDHGSWVGPCSNQKHEAIKAGLNPHMIGVDKLTKQVTDPVAVAFEMFRYALQSTRLLDDGIYCACCKTLYTRWSEGT